jgi:S-formylglutathione hydrolase
MKARILVFALAVTLLSPVEAQRKGILIDEKVRSASLAGNLLGDESAPKVTVYLPPSYRQGNSRYPVLYLLHGYRGTNRMFQTPQWVDVPAAADRFAREGGGEFILVLPNAYNMYGGSFYTDSAVTGDWETYMVAELVAHIDSKYRTVRHPRARGIAGHSMGGYGALKLAIKHPDIFGAVYALSPCCMMWGDDLSLENSAWADTLDFRSAADVQRTMKSVNSGKPNLRTFFSFVFVAAAAAWSPNPSKPPLYADFPVERADGKWRQVPAIAARWSANLILPLVPQYHGNLKRLRAIGIDVGQQEEFQHILEGSREFSRLLNHYKVPHTYEEYEGDHGNRIPHRMEKAVFPFFARAFADVPAAKQRVAPGSLSHAPR